MPQTFAYKEDSLMRIHIPIILNGKKLDFLFDTGAKTSIVNYRKLSPIMFLDTTNLCSMDINVKTYHKISKNYLSCGIYDITLGEAVFIEKQILGLHGFKNGEFVDNYTGDGIIGLNIISKYDWLFDTQNKTVTVFNKGSKCFPAINADTLTIIKEKKEDIFYTNVIINDSVKTRFLFDTGYGKKSRINDYHLTGDMIFVDSLYRFVNRNYKNCINVEYYDTISFQLIQDFKLDNIEMQDLSAFKEKLPNAMNCNMFTVGFFKRFNYMYYNGAKDEILLFKSKDMQNYKTDERELICRIKEYTLKLRSIPLKDKDLYKDIDILGSTITVGDNLKDSDGKAEGFFNKNIN
ncbi:hypothetical protein D0T85_14255 [Bacteroides sp. 519]|nr:hypothetical protein [Bacteroides sp. 519]